MRTARILSTLAATALVGVSMGACSAEDSGGSHSGGHGATETEAGGHEHSGGENHAGHGSDDGHESMDSGHSHSPDGGPAPEGIAPAEDPTHPVGSEVILHTDHMPGMDGAKAKVTGAFSTKTYAVDYTPTDGGEPVLDHKWVVQEELINPPEAPIPDGTAVQIGADHMPGMQGADGTIASSTDETVYMVDFEMDGMEMTNHKWVVESEISPA